MVRAPRRRPVVNAEHARSIDARTMMRRRLTALLAGLTLLVLALSLPGSLRDAFDRGGIYLFSRAFLEDIPGRLAGPGRFHLCGAISSGPSG